MQAGLNAPRAPHAVARLSTARRAISTRPFLARGGSRVARCEGCRLRLSHCLCGIDVEQRTRAGMCLLMHDAEPLKPTNTGWLIADVVADTFAFGWSRTEKNDALLALLEDPQWQPYVVFPREFVDPPERVVETVAGPLEADAGAAASGRRPLFILLDATWPQARKMFHKSPYLDRFPVLSLHPEQVSAYRLRRSTRSDHFCTSEVASLCLELAGETAASGVLAAWLDVFTHHYEQARNQLPPHRNGQAHRHLRESLSQSSAKPVSVS
ncbi:tRNA-uridine aminocarboxypropyltransferase [Diaphorobacter caeni]|uniref:tRNA-uridine aminocarboxypropyltransferase n=1 Tax=Diaphorobacter caeni TaxID=2784387 RepID=UPI00188FD561|nr:tRNA-uridine aminocarboxypropyltransferase [Diaphorobacter caeni]MBF5004839.1 DTW domain-containing protein [Diaphorobacter caeni]